MDNLTKSSLNFFTKSHLDRMAGIRHEKRDLNELINSPDARFVLIKKGKNLLIGEDGTKPHILKKNELNTLTITENNCFLLGTKEELTYFTIDLDNCNNDYTPPAESQFLSLRKSRINEKNWTGSLLAYSNALISWHSSHHYCGKCGSTTKAAELGQARYCINPDCASPHYPRTDPAIIVVVTNGDKCLMARKAESPPLMYSIVAGYVDHGESLEETVVREVMEETSIKVKSVHYHSSQPWPFPYTLMVGFFAEAENEDIVVDTYELEDAKWVSRKDLAKSLKEGTQILPSSYSISRKLITDWFNQGDLGDLSDYI